MQAPAPAPAAPQAPTGDVETLIKGISQGLAKLAESLLGSQEAPEELKAQATVATQEVSKLMKMLEGGAQEAGAAPTGNTTVEAGAREVEPVL